MIDAGIFTPLIYGPARHIYRLLTCREYLAYSILSTRLRNVPRFTGHRVNVQNWQLSIPDSASFLSAYKEIFVEKIYAFKFEGDAPRILDLGANIGLSVLFFKQAYPKAQITAFEADPRIFDYLKKNVHGNGFTDVQLLNRAAWNEDSVIRFSSEGADGGRAAFSGDKNLIEVNAINIADYLRNNRFDFLKMDIEGAEEFVFPACKDFLPGIRYVFVEYHSKAGQRQCLDKIINILAEAGFRIHIHSEVYSPSPFFEIGINSGFDLQLNIFGWKE